MWSATCDLLLACFDLILSVFTLYLRLHTTQFTYMHQGSDDLSIQERLSCVQSQLDKYLRKIVTVQLIMYYL